MARKPRIEYSGALYHVMSRGDRGGRIFKDEPDYELFRVAMREVCERCGWRLHAFVEMPNHFHWLLETPEANLVAGMKWFLGTYSQRFNARHGQRGHVFQGRYKAIPISSDSGDYFERISSYIHLNPARAKLLGQETKGLEDYQWSSFIGYMATKKNRPRWLAVDRVFGNLGLKDDRRGRLAYKEYMADRVSQLQTTAGRKRAKEEGKAIKYSWYLGDEAFKECLVKMLGNTVAGNERESYGGDAIRQHDEHQAEDLVLRGLKLLGLDDTDLVELPKGNTQKCALAWLVHSQTMASHRWITERLCMGVPSNMTRYVQSIASPTTPEEKRMKNKLKRQIPK